MSLILNIDLHLYRLACVARFHPHTCLGPEQRRGVVHRRGRCARRAEPAIDAARLAQNEDKDHHLDEQKRISYKRSDTRRGAYNNHHTEDCRYNNDGLALRDLNREQGDVSEGH
jgi:hypothetical protein